MTNKDWFDNCGGWKPKHDLKLLQEGISKGMLDAQDEYGLTALYLSVTSKWKEGVLELVHAHANTEVRVFRTGTTPLYEAVLKKDKVIADILVTSGADPDAANYWGVTPRKWQPTWFGAIAKTSPKIPDARIQNAEHLADQHYPNFKIPDQKERASLKIGQAVDVYVYGPKSDIKQDQVKVRISNRRLSDVGLRYIAVVESPIEKTHLRPDTNEVEFGPENVASIYLPPPK